MQYFGVGTSNSTDCSYIYYNDVYTSNSVCINNYKGTANAEEILQLTPENHKAFENYLRGYGLSAELFAKLFNAYQNHFGGGIKSMVITRKEKDSEEQRADTESQGESGTDSER